jgi:hypothetical protein
MAGAWPAGLEMYAEADADARAEEECYPPPFAFYVHRPEKTKAYIHSSGASGILCADVPVYR